MLCPPGFLLTVLGLPAGNLRGIIPIKIVVLSNGFGGNIAGNGIFFHHLCNMVALFRDGKCLRLHLFILGQPIAYQCIHGAAALLGQGFSQIGLGVLGIVIQHILKEAVRLVPVPVFQGHIAPVQQGGNLIVAAAAHHNTLLHHGHRLLLGQNLFNSPEQILHSAYFAHVLCLQFRKLLGHIVSVDALVAGNQVLGFVLCHELEIAAPLVLDPYGVVVFVIRAEGQHDFGGVQGGEDIRLVFLPQLVFQGNPGEEDPVALLRQGIIHILGNHAVHSALSVLVRLLIADENVIGLLLAGDLDNALADFLNLLGLLPVDPTGNHVRIFQSLLKVGILHDALEAGTVTGGNLLAGGRVVHILDAVLAQHQPPVGLRLLGEIGDDGLVNPRRFIKLTAHTQPVGTGKEGQLFLVILIGDSLPGAAVLALCHSSPRLYHQVATAHLALNHRHFWHPLFLSLQFPYAPKQIPDW